MDPDTKQKLLELCEASKAETRGIFFKRLVGDYELKLKSIEEARKSGYESGFRNARLLYMVSFPCADCGQNIFISGPELKVKVRKLIADAGWAHSECPRPNLPQPPPPKPIPPNNGLPKPNPPAVPVEKSTNQDKISRFLKDSEGVSGDESLP
jgi:hypothetical protein